MIFPLSWFPWIIWLTWPFLALMTVSAPGAAVAEAVWLGVLAFWRHRKQARRGRARKGSLKP